jgi:hypothetical protein
MDILDFLKAEYAANPTYQVDPSFVKEKISSAQDLGSLVEFCMQHPHCAASLFNNFSWDLFDKVYDFTLTETLADVVKTNLESAVRLLAKHTPPREFYMMVAEKLSVCTEVASFHVVLYALTHYLLSLDKRDSWRQGTCVSFSPAFSN